MCLSKLLASLAQ